jgi:hypothetical protein
MARTDDEGRLKYKEDDPTLPDLILAESISDSTSPSSKHHKSMSSAHDRTLSADSRRFAGH